MDFISKIFYFFTSYTDAKERAVGLFFKGLTEHSNQMRTRERLSGLLQRDIAVINLWSEYRYKGYRYLRKSERKKLYQNLQLITEDFDRFYKDNMLTNETVLSHVHDIAPHAIVEAQKAVLFQVVMSYLSPRRGVYEYRESSSFGRLLRDPSKEKLVGDCNQIVTLYIYLYSRYYTISDLKVRLLPGHIALHYAGVDIEATNGTFVNYDDREGNEVLPIEEIVSVNLLDTTDSYLSTHEVAAEDFLQSSRFAFILSHSRDIVTRNLNAAYSTLINSLMKRHSYSQALKVALASRDMTLLNIVGNNGALYEMQEKNYAAARRFAQHAPKRDDLIRTSWQAEGAHHYQLHHYHEAIKAFNQIGDQENVKRSYEALFFQEQDKLGSNITSESIKKYASVVKRMQAYAKKSGNRKLIEYTDGLTKYV